MFESRPFPTAAVLIALASGFALLLAGENLLLIGVLILVWIATFWLVSPVAAGAPAVSHAESVQLTRTGMRDLFEHSSQPVLMLDGMRIIVANAAAREALGTHVLGQDARVAFRHPEAVELLSGLESGSASIQGLTGPRSIWQITRQPLDQRYSLVELVNRTAEADISRAHTDFVANASHELRTPLASIIGYMETLVDEGDALDRARAAKFQTTVLREARRLQQLVSDLMSLSRVEAEKHDRPRDTVDLTQVVALAARDAAGPDRQDRLQIDLADEPLHAQGDQRQLEQLVRNLVDNALKYGAADRPVKVELKLAERQCAAIVVRDEGDGIAPEHLPHLTRRFYRTDPGRSRAAGGTGLGLAIVKHIVERHRGKLDIASRQGSGTVVTIRLPLAATAADATQASGSEPMS
ncbi:ATP-binding protein [Croceibacterium sp. TMG7-5b_MA50]|uniref:sensor histidine kinase n=1 Tax=Croceibacterium sp. TMG7-5b_MA50 TaxID=3121290 RepID=UPI003221719B